MNNQTHILADFRDIKGRIYIKRFNNTKQMEEFAENNNYTVIFFAKLIGQLPA